MPRGRGEKIEDHRELSIPLSKDVERIKEGAIDLG